MFQIDNQSRRAVYEQIAEQVERYIFAGVLTGGEKMPSVRNLSISLGVNPNTVVRAYTELERSGIIVTSPGRGTFVSENGAQVLKELKTAEFSDEFRDLVGKLKICGVRKSEICGWIDEIYAKRETSYKKSSII